jgi:hypothetical protein
VTQLFAAVNWTLMEKRKTHSSSSPSPSPNKNDNDIHQSYSKHFNENYQFSKTLIGKLVERTMLTSSMDQDNKSHENSMIKFPPPLIQEKKVPKKKNETTHEARDEAKEHPTTGLPNNFLEVSSTFPHLKISSENKEDDCDVNEKLVLSQSVQQPSSPVFLGGQHLPEYSKLKSKVTNAKGFIDLSNQNFGNHRIVVFTEALSASEKESDVQCLSLKGNRLTDIGICEIVRQLTFSLHKNLIFLDLSSNKVDHSSN